MQLSNQCQREVLNKLNGHPVQVLHFHYIMYCFNVHTALSTYRMLKEARLRDDGGVRQSDIIVRVRIGIRRLRLRLLLVMMIMMRVGELLMQLLLGMLGRSFPDVQEVLVLLRSVVL